MVRRTADILAGHGPARPGRVAPAAAAAAATGPGAAGPGASAGHPAAAPGAATGVLGPLVLFAFVMSLLVPGTLAIGPVNMTAYRLVLIAACIPLGLSWISGRSGPVSSVDLLYLASCVWISIALVMVHGLSRIIFIGTNFVELFGAYLIGRVLVRDAAGYRRFVWFTLVFLAILFPFVLIEFLTGQKLLQAIFGAVMSMKESALSQQRLGFTRAAGPFSHPIHFGLFASLAFANVYFLLWRRTQVVRAGAAAAVAFVTMLAISSGALFSLALQTAMILWDRGLAFLKSRWWVGVAIGVATLVFLLVSVQGGFFTYIVENLIFAQGAGEHRLDIYHYGTLQVLDTPWFGVGLGEWARPFWRPHPTIDSFWLMTAVRHGLPALLLLVGGMLVGMARIAGARSLDADGVQYRSGYMIALAGLLLIMSTVHIWGPVVVYVMAYLGAGAWFYTGGHARRAVADDPVRLRREREAARRAAETGAAGTGPGVRAGPVPPAGTPVRPPAGRAGQGARQEAIVHPHTLVYERVPGTGRGRETVSGGPAGRGAGSRGAAGKTAGSGAGPGPRKRV